MLLIGALSKQFKKVSKPEKFFRKSFIAAATATFFASYGYAGYLAWDSLKKEWNRESFEIHRMLPWKLAYNHGSNAIKALGVSYVGDASLIYAGAGILFWRNKRRKERPTTKSQQTLENL